MSHFYEKAGEHWTVHVSTGLNSNQVSAHDTEHEARAVVSYLNGGLHPELADQLCKAVAIFNRNNQP